jgi:hypothetical protein
LDCESYESALKSISDAHDLNVTDVVDFLERFDVDKEYETKKIQEACDRHLATMFRSHFGLQVRPWEAVCWFHLTRVPPGTDFAEGILPLHLALDKIWQTVIAISSKAQTKANLERLRQTGVPDHPYNLKISARIHSGPHAMLVKEVAFDRPSGYHDYLWLPEIIEDICNGYQCRYGERIHEEICAGLQKCIVKFKADGRDGSRVLPQALFYCWLKAHNLRMSSHANNCFPQDSAGVPVPRSAILQIEFL